jgi:hypothetical protein
MVEKKFDHPILEQNKYYKMKKSPSIGALLLPAMLVCMMSSCTRDINKNDNELSEPGKTVDQKTGALNKKSSMDEILQSVRMATARFHSTVQANKAGYETSHHCVSRPGMGGMGYHYNNPNLVDAVFDPLKPEVVLYARDSEGKLRLVAVEYIVLNVGQPRPMLGDHPFDIMGTPLSVPHWSLHVWLYEPNPNGMFIPFNPNISCN